MFKKDKGQLTIGEHLIYQNLPEDILSRINTLINWKPFEKILATLHPHFPLPSLLSPSLNVSSLKRALN